MHRNIIFSCYPGRISQEFQRLTKRSQNFCISAKLCLTIMAETYSVSPKVTQERVQERTKHRVCRLASWCGPHSPALLPARVTQRKPRERLPHVDLFGDFAYMLSLMWSCISSVQELSRVQLFATPCIAACLASLSFTISKILLKLMSIGDAIQPSHPLSSLSPPIFNLSQHQGLFQ